MARPCEKDGRRNLIAKRLVALRKAHHLSQRDLSQRLQLLGMDMDKNVITRIETNKRYVSDIELRALTKVFSVSYEELIEDEKSI